MTLRIGLLGPIAWRTPPRRYGPWELVTGLLADGLADRNVDVTLFATLDSVTRAKLEGVCPRPYEEDAELDGRVWEALHVAHVLSRSGDFDLIHNHLDWLPLAFSALSEAQMVTTIHGFSSSRIVPAYRQARSAFVSISDADRSPELDYVATVHHGVDPTPLPFCERGGDALVCFGRIHPDKGTHEAIAIAREAGRPLALCGPVQDERYWREQVEPHVDGRAVRYLGSVEPPERAAVLGRAACLLHPIAFEEPFGLSVVEAMICGTPVVAYPRGSMPEIVEEGVTGVLAAGVPDAVAAVERAARLDRAVCRKAALRRFDVRRMVDSYLRVYEDVLRGN
jgi:glycosyltransferase involved in cell wall biosynthesis